MSTPSRARGASPPSARPMLTAADVAERLRVSERTIRRWIDSRRLKAYRLNRAVRVSEDDLQSFLEQGR